MEDAKTNQEAKNGKDNKSREAVKNFFSVTWEILEIIIIAAIIVLPIRYFLFQPFIVKGESMAPNFQTGDYLIVDEISYRIGDPQRGDVVVLKYPLDPDQRFIKRIIGLPGETVIIRNGEITLSKDGKDLTLEEKEYLVDFPNTKDNLRVALAGNEYFVLGDNRRFSYDSRKWGVLPRKDIIGRAVLRIFPFKDMSLITAPSY